MISTALLIALYQSAAASPSAPPATDRLLAAAPSIADRANTTLQGYEVQGRNARSIRTSMNAARPSDTSGERHDAVTYWQYRYQMTGTNGRCDPGLSEVTYSVIVIMPDLASIDLLSRRERPAWDAYFAALTTHELNHIRIAEAGAQGIQNAMRAAPDCEAAQAAAAAESQRLAAASADYDRLTGHGRTEGAVY